MTRKELDFIGSMNMCDEISNEAYKKIVCHCEEQEPCEMTAEEYRQRMIQAFHNADCDRLIAVCVLPTEKEFEHLEWLLKTHYKKEPCEDAISRADAEALFRNARSELNPSDYKTADEFNTRDLMLLNAEQFIHLLPSVRPQEPKTDTWGIKEVADALEKHGLLEKESKWIPCSEKLPKEFESVLVCYKSQGGMAQCVSERFVNMDGSNRWSAMGGQEPIAWMPLPEPYKAESEG